MDTPNTDVIQGTLDMLILKTLSLEPMHGFGIARRVEQISRGVFKVNPGSLLTALNRLERSWMARSRVASDGQLSTREVLQPHARRKATARRPDRGLDASSVGGRTNSESRGLAEWRSGASSRAAFARLAQSNSGGPGYRRRSRALPGRGDGEPGGQRAVARGGAAGSATAARQRDRRPGTSARIRLGTRRRHDGGRCAVRRPAAAPQSGVCVLGALTLALGIGASTAIFSAVTPSLFQPLPYPDAGRLMMIWDRQNGTRMDVTFGTYRELIERSRSFESMAVMRPVQAP